MDTALYYTFSTIAQALAAAMALLAAFAMYRLGVIGGECFDSAVFMEAETGGGIKVRVLARQSDWAGVRSEIESKVQQQAYRYLHEDMLARLARIDYLRAVHRRILIALWVSLGLTASIMACSIAVLAHVPYIYSSCYGQMTLDAGVVATVVCLLAYLWLLIEAFRP
jgi:hypothetical protein